jgi:hypothetical protein
MTLLKIINERQDNIVNILMVFYHYNVTILTQRVINTMSIGYIFRTKIPF